MYIRGPFGAPSQVATSHHSNYDEILFIGAGVGVNPFISAIHTIRDRDRNSSEEPVAAASEVDCDDMGTRISIQCIDDVYTANGYVMCAAAIIQSVTGRLCIFSVLFCVAALTIMTAITMFVIQVCMLHNGQR